MKISKESCIVGGIALAFIIIFALIVWKTPAANGPKTVGDASLLVRADSHTTGSADATVVMVEFGDYQCPACGMVHPMLKQVIDAYKNNPKFSFVFRNFPLPQHANALISAEAAEAAGAQGKYWEMHDMLYEHQSEWSDVADPSAIFAGYAQSLSLNVTKFKSDITGKKFAAAIAADQKDAAALNLDHTPTVFLNGKEVDQGMTVDGLKAQIDVLLK